MAPRGRLHLSTTGRTDAALAAFVALAAFAIYLRTLLPDVGGYEDTPKFQYLGAVLGTAHAPGYPLHTLLSHLFSLIPLGTHAWRVNLLSATAAAATVGLLVLVVRAMGCRRAPAIFAALTLAFGFAFWNFAVLAEVYSLAALLLLAVIHWLLRWHATGERKHLFLASAAFALALGNHVTIVMTAPAIAAFVLLSPARRSLDVRTAATAFAIAAAGFLQYAYLAIRTYQGAAWVEARVRNPGDFASLFDSSRYESFIVPFTWGNFWAVALPNVAHQAAVEFGSIALVVAGLGLIVLLRRDWKTAMLLAGSAAGTAWIMSHFLGHQQGFLVPVWPIVAIVLAVGANSCLCAIARGPARVPLTAAITAGMLAYPLVPLRANFDANDWSDRTTEGDFLRRVVNALPADAALVHEGYVVDSMLAYLEAIEQAGHRSRLARLAADPEAIARAFDEGRTVFALADGHSRLAAHGFDFRATDLAGPTLAERLARLPAGYRVAIAGHDVVLPADAVLALQLDPAFLRQRPRRHVALTITIGDPAGAQFATDDDRAVASSPSAGEGAPLSQRLEATSEQGVAVVYQGSDRLAVTTRGLAVAIADPAGRVIEVHTPRPPAYRVGTSAGYRLYRLEGLLPSFDAGGGGWIDITSAVRDGSIDVVVDNYRPFESEVTIFAAAPAPLAPRFDGRFSGEERPSIEVTTFDRRQPASRAELLAALGDASLVAERLGNERFVARITHTVNDQGASAGWGLSFGGIPARVLIAGSTDLPSARRLRVSAPSSDRYPGLEGAAILGVGGSMDRLFGAGWHRPERDGATAIRWSGARDSYVMLPLDTDEAIRLSVTTTGGEQAGTRVPWLSLSFNGTELGACQLAGGWQRCDWEVPAALTKPGGNTIVMRVPHLVVQTNSPDRRSIGIALRQVLVEARD